MITKYKISYKNKIKNKTRTKSKIINNIKNKTGNRIENNKQYKTSKNRKNIGINYPSSKSVRCSTHSIY